MVMRAQMSSDLAEWRDRLNQSGKLIIVEGMKDKAALRSLGVKNRIKQLHKKPLYQVVEEVVGMSRDVIILTDLDKEGKRLYGRLNSDLSRFGMRVDNCFREYLFRNTKIRQIEGLSMDD
jgi:5S rRNA maturation endonuclease (ribonuclease M5)